MNIRAASSQILAVHPCTIWFLFVNRIREFSCPIRHLKLLEIARVVPEILSDLTQLVLDFSDWNNCSKTNVMILAFSVVKLYDVNKVDKDIQSNHKSVVEEDLSLEQLSSLCKSNPAAARSINI